MPNVLEEAISNDDGGRAAKIIQNALGIESDYVANYCFPKTRPTDREQRARIIGEWLQTEARFLASRPSRVASRRLGWSTRPMPASLYATPMGRRFRMSISRTSQAGAPRSSCSTRAVGGIMQL